MGDSFTIARPFTIRGEVRADSDLTIDAAVEGSISVPGHELTIGPHGRIAAPVHAKSVVVHGSVRGKVTATDVARVLETGRVVGDIKARRVVIADGAQVQGRVTAGP